MWHSTGVDTDAYSAANAARWERLAALSKKRGLSGAEADELAGLYHAASRDLSLVRTAAPDPHVGSRLSILIARARARLTGTL